MNWEREADLSVSTPWGEAGYDRLRRPDGEKEGFGWADPRDSVAVVAVREEGKEEDGEADDPDRQVVLVDEYRPRLRETVRTCPVGALEGEESFEAGAKRELREETGFRAGAVELLDAYYPVSWLRKRRGVVFATDLTPADPDRDDGEFTEIVTVPADEALSAVGASSTGGEREGPTRPATGWTLTPLLLARERGLL